MTEVNQLRASLIKIAELMGCDYDDTLPTDRLIRMTVDLVTGQQEEYHRWKQLYHHYTEVTGHSPTSEAWRRHEASLPAAADRHIVRTGEIIHADYKKATVAETRN
jgi:hypothetical protein